MFVMLCADKRKKAASSAELGLLWIGIITTVSAIILLQIACPHCQVSTTGHNHMFGIALWYGHWLNGSIQYISLFYLCPMYCTVSEGFQIIKIDLWINDYFIMSFKLLHLSACNECLISSLVSSSWEQEVADMFCHHLINVIAGSINWSIVIENKNSTTASYTPHHWMCYKLLRKVIKCSFL